MTFQLHDYQQKLVTRARNSYKDGYKFPLIVSPCGSGKSVIISEIARMTTDNNKRVLFLVHRRELIDQIRNTFSKNDVNLDLVEFGMVQTIKNKLDKIDKPDLIITDESHHAKAKTYMKIYEHFEDVLKLGFTATPVRLDGSGLSDVNDIMIEEVDVQYLIDNEFLSPFRYFAPKLIDDDELKLSSIREFTNKSIDEAMNNKIFGDAVRHYKKIANDEKAIAYCHSVESSIKTAQTFNANGIPAAHIDGKTPKDLRDKIIQDFRNGTIKVLSNVEIIGEGFDVPDCSTVILLRPTQSLSLYIQMAMRGMRYRPNKTSIIIDHVGNVERHGLPNMKREWSLNSKKTKNKKKADAPVKICDNCFNTVHSNTRICDFCGYEFPVEEKEIEIVEDAELEELDTSFTLDLEAPEDCTTMKELHQLAKKRKYKPGWVYYQAKRLNIKK